MAASPVVPPSPVPTPAPSASPGFDEGRRPFGPPEQDKPAFGAIERAWTVHDESVAVYGTRERPFAGKNPGTSTSYYVFVGGRVYGIHWDDLERFQALKPGETANLHPADMVVCKADPTDPDGNRCWRLYHVYPGPRRINPLGG